MTFGETTAAAFRSREPPEINQFIQYYYLPFENGLATVLNLRTLKYQIMLIMHRHCHAVRQRVTKVTSE